MAAAAAAACGVVDNLRVLPQVSMWVQLQVPKIEDGNNFGVAVQVGPGRRRLAPPSGSASSSPSSLRRKCSSC